MPPAPHIADILSGYVLDHGGRASVAAVGQEGGDTVEIICLETWPVRIYAGY